MRELYRNDDGTLGFRCPSEPTDTYLAKGGKLEDTIGRKCLCNALLADIGLAQVQRGNQLEAPLVTSGDDLLNLNGFLEQHSRDYTATDVITYLLA